MTTFPIEGTHGFNITHLASCRGRGPVWLVELPHQCDDWVITTAADPVAELDVFIAETRAARARLAELAGARQTAEETM